MWVSKNPAKFPENFQQDFPANNQEISIDELLQERREKRVFIKTLPPSLEPVVYEMSGPMGGGFLYATHAEAESSAVKIYFELPENQCIKISLPASKLVP